MTEPILVKDYKGDQAFTIRCQACDAEAVIHPDDLSNEDIYDCPDGCGAIAEHKYWLADECPNCGKLGFWAVNLDYCCSRVCQLQNEYRKATA